VWKGGAKGSAESSTKNLSVLTKDKPVTLLNNLDHRDNILHKSMNSRMEQYLNEDSESDSESESCEYVDVVDVVEREGMKRARYACCYSIVYVCIQICVCVYLSNYLTTYLPTYLTM